MIDAPLDQSDLVISGTSVPVRFGCVVVSFSTRLEDVGVTARQEELRGSISLLHQTTRQKNTADMFSRISRPSASLARCLSTTSQVKVTLFKPDGDELKRVLRSERHLCGGERELAVRLTRSNRMD